MITMISKSYVYLFFFNHHVMWLLSRACCVVYGDSMKINRFSYEWLTRDSLNNPINSIKTNFMTQKIVCFLVLLPFFSLKRNRNVFEEVNWIIGVARLTVRLDLWGLARLRFVVTVVLWTYSNLLPNLEVFLQGKT